MKALDFLTAGMKEAGIYALTGTTAVDYELQSYAAGFDPVCDALERLQTESFAATAEDYGLLQRERLFGLTPRGSLADRREAVLSLGTVAPGDNTRQALEQSMRAAGLDCEICEFPETRTLYLNCPADQDTAYLRDASARIAKLFLPAHLNGELDFRSISWNNIDQTDSSFDASDSRDLTWDAIDHYGDGVLQI